MISTVVQLPGRGLVAGRDRPGAGQTGNKFIPHSCVDEGAETPSRLPWLLFLLLLLFCLLLLITVVSAVASTVCSPLRLKTANGFRQVDIHPAIATLLKEFVGDRKSGFLFCTRTGRPVSPSNIIRRHLHRALKKLKYVNIHTGMHKAGNHAFRRFRNTFLRNYTDCPEGLYKYWLGHAGKDMSDLYDKI